MMLSLLDNRYAPLTYSIGFLNAPIAAVAQGLALHISKIHERGEVKQLGGGFEEALAALEPLTMGIRPRILLTATKMPEWTAFFDAHAQGQGVSRMLALLAKGLRVRGYYTASVPPNFSAPGQLGARQFRVCGPETLLGEVRSIDLVETDPGKWIFETSGEIQAFEDIDAYTRRRKTERLTEQMLVEYAEAVGLRPWDDSFYTSPFYLFTNEATPVRSYTLVQARQRLGLAADV